MNHIKHKKLLVDNNDGSCTEINYFINTSQKTAIPRKGESAINWCKLHAHICDMYPSLYLHGPR